MKLEVGYNHPFEIRRETCRVQCSDSFSVLYLSDLHLNRYSAKTVERISSAIAALDPTLILLGGDYADSKQGLMYFEQLMQSIAHRKHVYAVAGNHDHRIGISKVEQIMKRSNAVWIENASHELTIGSSVIRLDGNCVHTKNAARDFAILVLHKPLHTDTFKDGYDLVLAGHLHGSQFVFWRNGDAMYPGRIFYRWNVLKEKLSSGDYFISKGLGDTLPLRYNCKRDMIFINVEKKL
jgi:predicted MPP superfamily phosphohydrolase